jgi:hypothetical protein
MQPTGEGTAEEEDPREQHAKLLRHLTAAALLLSLIEVLRWEEHGRHLDKWDSAGHAVEVADWGSFQGQSQASAATSWHAFRDSLDRTGQRRLPSATGSLHANETMPSALGLRLASPDEASCRMASLGASFLPCLQSMVDRLHQAGLADPVEPLVEV